MVSKRVSYYENKHGSVCKFCNSNFLAVPQFFGSPHTSDKCLLILSLANKLSNCLFDFLNALSCSFLKIKKKMMRNFQVFYLNFWGIFEILCSASAVSTTAIYREIVRLTCESCDWTTGGRTQLKLVFIPFVCCDCMSLLFRERDETTFNETMGKVKT